MKNNVIVRYYSNNQVSVHCRKDVGDCKVAIHEQWAHSRSDVQSTVFKNIRAGLLRRVELVIPKVSDSEGKSYIPAVEKMLEHQGYGVIKAGA